MNTMKTNEAGRSMIEMLGVLAIIGVLSVGGIAGYSKAMNKFKTNKVADNVSMIVANIKTLYAQQKTYDGLTTANAITLGVVPDELVKTENSTKVLRNAYNGEVEIHTAGSTTAANTGTGTAQDKKAFVIYFAGLSKEACITLATNDWGSSYSSGLIAIQAASKGSASLKAGLDDVLIGANSSAVLTETTGSEKAIAMPAATGVNKADGQPDVSQVPVPMPVSVAAKACACNEGNTCSLTWKYY